MRQHSYFGVPFVNAASPRTISVDKKKYPLEPRVTLVSRTVKTQKLKFLYFRNETCYRNGNLYTAVQRFTFCLSST